MSRIFAFMSGKGGVGKSTIASALALYYASHGLKTVLVDGDIGLRCADLMLGMQDQVVYDLGDLCRGYCKAEQALLHAPGLQDLSLLAAPQLMKPSDLKAREVTHAVHALAEKQDIILIDAPAGIGRGLKNLLDVESTPVIIATPDDVSMRDAERLGNLLSEKGESHPGLVFNRVDRRLVTRGEMMPPAQLAQALDLPLMGIIPNSPKVYRALLRHENALNCGDAQVKAAIEVLGSRLLGAKTPLPEYAPSPIRAFFSRGGNRL